MIHRVILFFFTLLTVFFLFRHGHDVAARLRGLSDRLLGERGEQIALHMMAAVHGTVTGLVLVGLGEGLLLGIVYVAVGLPYAASLGMLTGVAAIIPFAAPVAYCLCALYLFAGGNTVGGTGGNGSGGGGVLVSSGTATITGTTIDGNRAGDGAAGGGGGTAGGAGAGSGGSSHGGNGGIAGHGGGILGQATVTEADACVAAPLRLR